MPINHFNLPIIERKKLSEDIYEVSFGLRGKAFVFEPGQYIHTVLPRLLYNDHRGNRRDFSLASSPDDKQSLRIVFRNSESGFKRSLVEMPFGSRVKVSGPFGVFTLPKNPKPICVFIAGGIGITPFLSMLRSASDKKIAQRFSLLYINSDKKTLVYKEELDKLQKQNNRFTAIYRFGRPTKQYLRKYLTHHSGADFYIAGPPQMVADTQALLLQIGISEKNIVLEEFSGYNDDFGDPSDRLVFGSKGELSERPLADLEALLQALSTSGLVSETNAQGTITYANDKFVEISKYSRAELIGQNHRILKSGFHSPSFYENLWATITRGKVWRGEIKNRAKDGSYYWVDTSIAPIVGKDNKPIKYISVRFPITERRQAEEEVKERSKQQAVITLLSQQALASTNIQTLMNETVKLVAQTLNVQFCKVLKILPDGNHLFFQAGVGWKAGIVGSLILDKHPRNGQIAYILNSRKPVITKDLRTETRFVGSSVLHDHGVVSGVSVIIRWSDQPYGVLSVYSNKERTFSRSDINFLQAVANLIANAERQQLDRRKDQFISTASHELRTPLTSIKNFTQILQRRFENSRDKSTHLFLSKIDSQLIKLTNLIGDLLDISKIQTGKLQYNDEIFSLDDLIEETISDLQLTANSHTISYKNKGKCIIFADRYRIGQVLTNMISNAIKYSPDANKVIINSLTAEDEVTVSVQDFGVGISKQDQSHVFERFYQGESKKKQQFPGGLGLGLYITSEIVKRYAGRIWVKSDGDKGSIFTFAIPVSKSS